MVNSKYKFENVINVTQIVVFIIVYIWTFSMRYGLLQANGVLTVEQSTLGALQFPNMIQFLILPIIVAMINKTLNTNFMEIVLIRYQSPYRYFRKMLMQFMANLSRYVLVIITSVVVASIGLPFSGTWLTATELAKYMQPLFANPMIALATVLLNIFIMAAVIFSFIYYLRLFTSSRTVYRVLIGFLGYSVIQWEYLDFLPNVLSPTGYFIFTNVDNLWVKLAVLLLLVAVLSVIAYFAEKGFEFRRNKNMLITIIVGLSAMVLFTYLNQHASVMQSVQDMFGGVGITENIGLLNFIIYGVFNIPIVLFLVGKLHAATVTESSYVIIRAANYTRYLLDNVWLQLRNAISYWAITLATTLLIIGNINNARLPMNAEFFSIIGFVVLFGGIQSVTYALVVENIAMLTKSLTLGLSGFWLLIVAPLVIHLPFMNYLIYLNSVNQINQLEIGLSVIRIIVIIAIVIMYLLLEHRQDIN